MMGKVSKALVFVLAVSLVMVSSAYAEEDVIGDRIRVGGRIMGIDLQANTFSLHTLGGDDLQFIVTPTTRFRSPGGSIQKLSDLEVGMRALVIGTKSESELVALAIVAAKQDDPDRVRVFGEVIGVASTGGSFSLEKRDGEVVTILTDERTHFRSRDGSIQGLDDLETGMIALVIAVEQEDGGLLGLVVAAGHKQDLPNNLRRFKGEITKVVPGQDTFSLETREGEVISFQTNDRTRFVSRDGSVTDIHDLKKGMIALVGAVEKEEGTLMAIFVAAADIPDRPVDVRVGGQIISLGERSFTIETRGGDRMTFSVDGSTKYKLRDGSVEGFDDLQVGMLAIVGAKELGNDDLKAVWVGVGWPPAERDGHDTSRLEERPLPLVVEGVDQ